MLELEIVSKSVTIRDEEDVLSQEIRTTNQINTHSAEFQPI